MNNDFLKNYNLALPGPLAQWVGTLSHIPKVCGLDSSSGHTPRKQPVRVLSHIDVCLFLSLSLKNQ